MLLAILADVRQVELLRHLHVVLDRTALPRTADRILEVEVDLRAVERAIALIDDVVEAAVLEGLAQAVRREFPVLIRAHGIIRARRELGDVRQAERVVDFIEEVDRVLDLLLDLIRRDEEMRIVLREVADAEQAVELAGLLVAMDEAEFAEAQRQVAVAVLLGVVDEHAARAVHRLDGVVFTVDLREVHVLFVVIPVAGRLPELAVQDDRRLDLLVAIAAMDIAPVVDELVADDHAVRMEEREARAFLVQAEEVELLAELAVVALLGLLEHVEVGIEVCLLLEGRAVDALQHLVVLIAAPVSTSDAHELQGLDLARRDDVRASAEIRELALRVHRDLLAFRQVVDELDLVGLALLLEELQGLFAADFLALELEVLLDDLLHLFLDIRKIGFRQLTVDVEVIVEAILDGWADGQAHIGILVEALDGLCEDVGSRVAQCPAAILVVERQKLYLAVFIEDHREIFRLAVHLSSQHLLGQAVAYLFHEILDADAGFCLAHCTVFHGDL